MRALLTILYVAAAAAVVLFSYREPFYNWDMLPYMALALDDGGAGPDSIHAATYEAARALLPREKYDLLVDSTNVYRRRTFREPATFRSELAYYTIKPLYILAVRASYKLGLPLTKATLAPSLLGYLAIAFILLLWLRAILPDPYATLIALALILAPFMLQSVRGSTPDLLAGCMLLGGVYLIMEKRSPLTGLPLLAAAALVRVDALLFVLPALAWLYYFRFLSRPWLFGGLAAAAAIAAITFASRSGLPGEMLLMMRSSSERIAGGNGSYAGYYLRGVMHGFAGLQFSSIFLVAAVAIAALLLRARRGGALRKDIAATMILLMFIHIAIRYLLYPIIEDRFLIADYLLIAIGAAMILRDARGGLSPG